MGAGDILVPPPGSHFKVVMPEVRVHLKALTEISRDFVFHLVLPQGYNVLGFGGNKVMVCQRLSE